MTLLYTLSIYKYIIVQKDAIVASLKSISTMLRPTPERKTLTASYRGSTTKLIVFLTFLPYIEFFSYKFNITTFFEPRVTKLYNPFSYLNNFS